jgi:hypothetical protein
VCARISFYLRTAGRPLLLGGVDWAARPARATATSVASSTRQEELLPYPALVAQTSKLSLRKTARYSTFWDSVVIAAMESIC